MKLHSAPLSFLNRMYQHWAGRTLIHTLAGYVILTMVVALIQRYLVYHPHKSERLSVTSHKYLPHSVDLSITTHDGLTLNGWMIRSESVDPSAQVAENRQAILYFPGNAGHREFRIDRLELLANLGRDVVIFDYRGYGDNPGKPTEKHLRNDALSIWQHLVAELGYRPENIAVWGESLGGGVATDLAFQLALKNQQPEALIMQSTFSSLVKTAGYHYPWLPVSLVMIDRYDSRKKLPKISCPIMIIHGTADTVIPYTQAEANHQVASKRKSGSLEFITLEGIGHNSVLERCWDELKPELSSFLGLVPSEAVSTLSE